MEPTSRILHDRSRLLRLAHRRTSIFGSIGLHALIVVAVFVVPALMAKTRAPKVIEYVEVFAMPAAALQPAPTPRPRRAAPQPTPAPREPEPEPEPVSTPPPDIPTLPTEKPKPPAPEPEPRPTTAPEPSATETEPDDGRERSRLPAASTGTSTNSATVTLDDPDFVYSYYLDQLLQRIREHYRRPDVREGIEMVATFRISTDGTVTDLAVLTSSGAPALDRAGIRAIRSASPLLPLPRGYKKPSLGVELIVR